MYKKNNYKWKTGDHRPVSEYTMETFTNLLVNRIEEMEKSHWKKGWVDDGCRVGLPQNIRGGTLNGSNAFFLYLHTAEKGFSMPVYLTFLQANELGLSINEGAESVPVIYWQPYYEEIVPEGERRKPERLTWEEYRDLSDAEKEKFERKSTLRYYPEFNVDQTNLKEVKPDLYAKLLERFKAPEVRDAEGMYTNEAIDRMLERQEWVCPVHYDKQSRDAFYRPSSDDITIPMKSQFKISDTPEEIYKDGMEYYSTFIHEAAHSTGSPNRLNREKGGRFGDQKYAMEELVAEMSAAVVGSTLGFSKRILDNNISYVKGWIENMRKSPKVALSVTVDVGKASNMILEKINEQKIALGEKPVIDSHPLLDDKDSRSVRLETFEPRAIDMIVRRASNPKAKSFSQGQREIIDGYIKAATGGNCTGNVEVRQRLFSDLFAKAEVKLKEMNISKAWIEDTRKELMDMAAGIVRDESRGRKR